MLMRILTINVQNLDGDPRRQQFLNEELRRLSPDLLALQEVVQSEELRQLDELLAGSGLNGTHQAQTLAYEPPWADRYGGTAIATRWPHRVVETLDLRLQDAADVPWCTLAAVVEVPGEGEMVFVSTTASWRLDAEAARERQALALADLDTRHRRALPTVIAGDFNADPDAASIRFLTGRQSLAGRSVYYQDAWAAAGEGPGHTWTDANPVARAVIDQIVRQPGHARRIDYVLIGSGHAHSQGSCRVRSAKVVFDRDSDGVWASDHFGVLVEADVEATG
jgi:endonuclease/exonuclease/phosphatase family metal-dependent hydrolase